ncbi:MAG: hypothetical protein JW953_14675 [Anaerolineae bacterium]|nr:hypothetical protein [Anaerolineae bacterium]
MNLSNFFGRWFKKKSGLEELARRINRAAESILENEQLTADLDDAAAKELLNWGIAWAKLIAQRTGDLDDSKAQAAMSPQLQATRRLMRAVNKWVVNQQEGDTEGSAAALAQIIEQANLISVNFSAPNNERAAFISQQTEHPVPPQQMIVNLRRWLEDLSGITPQGEPNDQT